MVSNPRLWNHIFSKSENFKNAFFANPDSRLETVSIIIALSISREGGDKVIWGQLEFLTARNFTQLIFIYLKFIFLFKCFHSTLTSLYNQRFVRYNILVLMQVSP